MGVCHYFHLLKLRKKLCYVAAVVLCVFYGISSYNSYCESFWNPRHVNYFLDSSEIEEAGLTMNTSGCQILDLALWDSSLSSFFVPDAPPDDCSRNKHWTYIEGQSIILNVTAMHEDGYSLKAVSCCYHSIERVTQSLENYNMEADSVIKLSEECITLVKERTLVKAEFVRIRCTGKYWPYFQDVIYRNHHAIAQPKRTEETWDKVKFWGNNSQRASPSILVLGIDSMSRRNFHRTMKRTKVVLERIGAVEMLGYTKVGENTFPNTVPLLTGYLEEDLERICYFNSSVALDGCPFVWKRFNRAMYLTAHVEDSPGLQAFSRYKTGFVKQQVDFYLRPLMLDAFGMVYAKDCMGPDTQDEKVFHYIRSIANVSATTSAPYFIFVWLTNLAHSDMNGGVYGDSSYAKFLETSDLSNTVLFFMSDHGFRYGAFRETLTGWYEDKLPNLWVYLPPSLREKYPNWFPAVTENSRRLLSPFDLHVTFNHLLDEFTDSVEDADASVQVNETTRQVLPRKFGQSVLKPVPADRTCADAGINPHYCACKVPRKMPFSDPQLQAAAEAAIVHINRLLPSQCQTLSLKEVTAGASVSNDQDEFVSKRQSYTVTFVTKPGDFLFEATVIRVLDSDSYALASDVLRMSKMTNDLSCIHDPKLERFCYCK